MVGQFPLPVQIWTCFFDFGVVACDFSLLKLLMNCHLPPVSSAAYSFWLCIKLGCCKITTWSVLWSTKFVSVVGNFNLESMEECIIILIISCQCTKQNYLNIPVQSGSAPKIILCWLYQYSPWRFEDHRHTGDCTCGLQSLWGIQLPASALCYSAADLYTNRKYFKANLNQVPLLCSVHLADILSLKITCRKEFSAACTFLLCGWCRF